MELVYLDYIEYKKIKEHIVATIGQFDGLHIAHMELINKTLDISKNNQIKSAVITFNPTEEVLIKSNEPLITLTTLKQKIDILSKMNIDYLIVIKFDNNIRTMDPEKFVNNFLLENNVVEMIVGFDFKFGYKGLGKPKDIEQFSNNSIKVNIIDEKRYNGEKIGSTLIRNLLKNAELKTVKYLLGRYFQIEGKVVVGNKIGRTINLPTANLILPKYLYDMKNGVYATRITFENQIYYGFSNIGYNPSFNKLENKSLETHIFDFNDDIYGKNIKIEFIDFIREERKFSGIDSFLKQIEIDRIKVLEILKNIK